MDRGKLGVKRHVFTDDCGVSLESTVCGRMRTMLRATGRFDLRYTRAFILIATGIGGVEYLVRGILLLPKPYAWGGIAFGLGLFAVAAGVRQAREWAKWTAGLIALAHFVAAVVYVASADPSRSFSSMTNSHFYTPWFGFIALIALGPGSKARFEDARAAMARAKAEKPN